MVVREIYKLREELNMQVLESRPFDEIYSTSIKIDALITEYYNGKASTKQIQKV